jgi:hypothetical protein
MFKLFKTVTDSEILFHLSGERLLIQFIEKFFVHNHIKNVLINQLINHSIAKNQKKIEACQCLLDEQPQASILFQAVDAFANRTECIFRFPSSYETEPHNQSEEFRWLNSRCINH